MHKFLARGMYDCFIDAMLMAAFSLAFFAYLRCGEFTVQNGKEEDTLNIEDILMDDSMSAFTLVLKSSKTDPF
jgi:hypothetical protein